jgi:acylphosphatase
MSEILTRHLLVRGQVQGVGYRNYISHKAGVLGIRGWVRNCSDGTVEAVVQGSAEAVAEIIRCAERGPRTARVDQVDIAEAGGEFPGFTVRQTK